jgi:uncharacterized membrane protein YhdT
MSVAQQLHTNRCYRRRCYDARRPVGTRLPLRLQLFLATTAILALELAMIRWVSHQVRIFAYLSNVLLMGAFLGMGVGVLAGRRRASLFHWTLPSLAVLVAVFTYAKPLGLMHLGFPDRAVALWNAPAESFAGSLTVVMLLFALLTWTFVCAGTIVGDLFSRIQSLQAYSYDLLGSLVGIIVITLLAAYGTSPPVWFAAACIPLLVLSPRPVPAMAAVAVLILTTLSIDAGLFSPYYRIDLTRATNITGAPIQLSVNRDFHQYINDLSDARIARVADPAARRRLRHAENAYALPFDLTARKDRALILGAGTGNDAAAAVRRGFREVVSVDIDPLILILGRALHPERPYDRPGVQAVVNDARAYLEQNRGRSFDVVCFGLLDSHAMFSTMSSLRLDNYVYTVESLRSAWAHVRPGGVLTMSFAVGSREWLSDRLFAVMTEATGQRPMVVFHGVQGGRTYIAFKGAPSRERLMRIFHRPESPDFVPMHILPVRVDLNAVRPSTDDWPFLYLRPGAVPWGYIAVLVCILAMAVAGARWAVGGELFQRQNFDLPLFFMGAAFLLIETRGVTDLSLLFGSTWIVNAVVFVGILLTVLVVNEIVRRWKPRRMLIFFPLLFAALLLNYAIGPSVLLQLDLAGRAIAGGLLNALPVAFAGVIFSSLLDRAGRADLALGANLLGAVAGGCLEYSSMWTGLRALSLVAIVLYLFAALAILRATPPEPRASVP